MNTVLQSVFGTYFLASILTTFPRELLEAAALDGATKFQVLRRAVLHILRPTCSTRQATQHRDDPQSMRRSSMRLSAMLLGAEAAIRTKQIHIGHECACRFRKRVDHEDQLFAFGDSESLGDARGVHPGCDRVVLK